MSVARIKVVGITHWITTQHTGLVGEILEYVSPVDDGRHGMGSGKRVRG